MTRIALLLTTFVLQACHLNAPALRTDTQNLNQREVTEPTALVDSEGVLVAPGWSRKAQHYFALDQLQGELYLLRQWDYYAILLEDLVVDVTIANIRFAAFCSVTVNDLATGEMYVGARGKLSVPKVVDEMPTDNTSPVACHDGDGNTLIQIQPEGDNRRITFAMPGGAFSDPVSGSVLLQQDPTYDYYSGVFPFDEVEKGFFYENKVPGIPVTGNVYLEDQHWEITEDAYAVRDWGRGIWPPKLVWQWGMAGGMVDGKRLDFNFGAGFGNVNRGTENIAFVDGVGHKLAFVNWTFNRDDVMQPWTLEDPEGRFYAELKPIASQPIKANLIFKGVKIHKVYGHFSGWVILDDGSKMEFKDLLGFTEEVYIRW